jgi:hypothetical protein
MAKKAPDATVPIIRCVARKKYSAEEDLRIVLEGPRGVTCIAALCNDLVSAPARKAQLASHAVRDGTTR